MQYGFLVPKQRNKNRETSQTLKKPQTKITTPQRPEWKNRSWTVQVGMNVAFALSTCHGPLTIWVSLLGPNYPS